MTHSHGRRLSLVVLGGWLVIMAMPAAAGAGPITFTFTGVVSDVPVDEAGTGIASGDGISGSFTFDSAALDLIAADNAGSYQVSGVPYGITATIGANLFATSDSLAVSVANDFPPDQYAVLGCSVDLSCSSDLQIELLLQDLDGTVFAGDDLPLTPPLLGSFEIKDFHLIALVGGNQLQVDGVIDSLDCPACEIVPVPEPSSVMLLATGLGALFKARQSSRRRKPQSHPFTS